MNKMNFRIIWVAWVLPFSAYAQSWDELLKEKFLEVRSLKEIGVLHSNEESQSFGDDRLYTGIRASAIHYAEWPTDAPRPIYVAWVPTSEMANYIRSLKVFVAKNGRSEVQILQDNASKRGPQQQYGSSGLIVDIRNSVFQEGGSGARIPFDTKCSFLIIEQRPTVSGNDELLLWMAPIDYTEVFSRMAETECWVNRGTKHESAGSLASLRFKRGTLTVILNLVAPGGRILTGANTITRSFEIGSPTNQGKTERVSLQWGHGVIDPKVSNREDLHLVADALNKNGIKIQAKLIGRHLVMSSANEISPLQIEIVANGETIARDIALKCPMPLK